MKVSLFIPCFVDQLFPQTAQHTLSILEKLGCKVEYNDNQTCCAQPAFNAGFWDEAKVVAQKFINDFPDSMYIVSPSGSCVGMVKSSYSELFTNSASHNKCRSIQQNIFELTDFIINVLKVENIGARFPHKVTYHDACGALRECGIKESPRTLLKNVQGLELIEVDDCETCCGFGGTFAVKFEAISTAMAEQKVLNAIKTGAEYIVSTDISCLMHMQAYIDKNNLAIKTIHIVDVLATCLSN